jgi:hypothetical protein
VVGCLAVVVMQSVCFSYEIVGCLQLAFDEVEVPAKDVVVFEKSRSNQINFVARQLSSACARKPNFKPSR